MRHIRGNPAPIVLLCSTLFCMAAVLATGSLQARVHAPPQSTPGAVTDTASAARRWPAEIENLLAAQAGDGGAPRVETEQRCSRVADGLAHCVMVECQTRGGRTACFEMVMTARRLRGDPLDRDDDGGAAPASPRLRVQPTGLRDGGAPAGPATATALAP